MFEQNKCRKISNILNVIESTHTEPNWKKYKLNIGLEIFLVGNVCFNFGFIFEFLTLLMYSFVVFYGNFKTDLLLSLLLWIFLCLSNAIFCSALL